MYCQYSKHEVSADCNSDHQTRLTFVPATLLMEDGGQETCNYYGQTWGCHLFDIFRVQTILKHDQKM